MKIIINEKDMHNIKDNYRLKELLKYFIDIFNDSWGENRDYKVTGGYIVLIEDTKDLSMLNDMYIDIKEDIAELVYYVKEDNAQEFYVALFIMNDDFNIVVAIPNKFTNGNIINQVTDNIEN